MEYEAHQEPTCQQDKGDNENGGRLADGETPGSGLCQEIGKVIHQELSQIYLVMTEQRNEILTLPLSLAHVKNLRYSVAMRIEVFTLFPAMFDGPLTESILKRAQENGLLTVACHNIRDYATDKHHMTDEAPYGGGGGMVMKVEPIVRAVETVLGDSLGQTPVILTTPQGRVFSQAIARQLAEYPRLAIICGRYEGVDERVRRLVVTDEISIGDYVLTGGELPAMVMIDAIARHIPGVLGARWAADEDSHTGGLAGLLEYAHYTRPPVYRGLEVPTVLVNGDHGAIERWRRQDAIRRTWERRPDLLLTAALTEEEKYSLAALADMWTKLRTAGEPHNG